uniref:DDE_Tnp_1_7 domain-containing protein n=1 Tax=Heterorhabditis bacteriophora TaxID=37862 RepID=A0A1I7XBA6_HETBA
MSKTTSDLNIGPVSVRRIVKCELGTYSYKIRQVHMLMEKLSRNIWPSNSPDLNPMDFAILSILENMPSRTF